MPYLISQPRYVRPDNSMIDVIWDHPRLGEIPYTAVAEGGDANCIAIWDGLIAGEYGEIAAYDPPPTE